jgi:hypothetical protein
MVLVQCKICLEEYPFREIEAEELISPCSCKGNAKYVHRRCLDRWHQEDGTVGNRCTICNTEYKHEDAKLLTEVEFITLLWIGICLIWYFIPVFFLVHCIRLDENYSWYLNTSNSTFITWHIFMALADGIVAFGLLVAVLAYLLSLGHFNPVCIFNGGKGDHLYDTGHSIERSYDGTACYILWFFVGVCLILVSITACDGVYTCLEARLKRNRKIKSLDTGQARPQ